MKIYSFLHMCTTLGPIGYLPASGTIASLITIPLIYALRFITPLWYGVLCMLLTVISGIIIHYVCLFYAWHDDPPMIVLDEVVGMLFLFWFIPFRTDTVILSFLLFRLFDISKVCGISYLEKLPSSLGILADDLGAAFYAQILVHLYIWMM